MTALTERIAWQHRGWVPELSFIEWPRLEELFEAHEEAVRGHRSADPAGALRRRFADEDERAEEAYLEAARNGKTADVDWRTPEPQRQAEIRVAQERAAEGLSELCVVAGRVIDELVVYAGEFNAAHDEARVRCGMRPLPRGADDLTDRDNGDIAFMDSHQADEINAAADIEIRQADASAMRHLLQRKQLGADVRAFRAFQSIYLLGGGAQVLLELRQAFPGGDFELALNRARRLQAGQPLEEAA